METVNASRICAVVKGHAGLLPLVWLFMACLAARNSSAYDPSCGTGQFISAQGPGCSAVVFTTLASAMTGAPAAPGSELLAAGFGTAEADIHRLVSRRDLAFGDGGINQRIYLDFSNSASLVSQLLGAVQAS